MFMLLAGSSTKIIQYPTANVNDVQLVMHVVCIGVPLDNLCGGGARYSCLFMTETCYWFKQRPATATGMWRGTARLGLRLQARQQRQQRIVRLTQPLIPNP